jgi:hypothetical protein
MAFGPGSPRGSRASLVGPIAIAIAIASCTTPATEVVVSIDSDIAPGRSMHLDVYVTTPESPAPTSPTRTWNTDSLDGGFALPASFAVVPGDGRPRDETVVIVAELHVSQAGPDQPALTLRRRARFRFTPQRTLAVPLFLTQACNNAAVGCTSVADDACTLATRCEELGTTCGNEARCVAIETEPVPLPSDGNTLAADRTDVFVPPPAPRAIAPLSNTSLTAGSVTFRYDLPTGADGARIELCSTRACDSVLRTIDADGSTSAPVTDLAPGLHWYRLRSRADGALGPPGAAWPFRTLANGAGVARHAFTLFDANGDGFSDTAIGNPMTGEVAVFRGSASGFETTPSQSLHDATPDFARVIASAGDVNGDGFADLAVAAPSSSRVMVYYGGEQGFPASPSIALPGASEMGGDSFGYDIAAAGDVDGDGYGDLLVGKGFVSTVFVYRGSANGIVVPAAAILRAPDLNARFGTALSGAGDVNGDGFADALIGAWGLPGDHGTAYVFQGSASGLLAAPWATMQGTTPDDQFGSAVSAAGDVDADGFADVLVSSPAIDEVTLFRGGAATLGTLVTVLRPPPAIMQFARFGISSAPAGDFDGEGFGDFALGAQDIARVYVYRGGAGAVSTTASHTLAANPDTNGSGFGRVVGEGGDCNGDGRGDVLVGSTVGYTAWAYYGRAPATADLYADRYWTGPPNFGIAVAR